MLRPGRSLRQSRLLRYRTIDILYGWTSSRSGTSSPSPKRQLQRRCAPGVRHAADAVGRDRRPRSRTGVRTCWSVMRAACGSRRAAKKCWIPRVSILRKAEQLKAASGGKPSGRPLRLGILPTIPPAFVAQCIARLRAIEPGRFWRTEDASLPKLQQRLANGRYDVVLTALGSPARGHLQSELAAYPQALAVSARAFPRGPVSPENPCGPAPDRACALRTIAVGIRGSSSMRGRCGHTSRRADRQRCARARDGGGRPRVLSDAGQFRTSRGADASPRRASICPGGSVLNGSRAAPTVGSIARWIVCDRSGPCAP